MIMLDNQDRTQLLNRIQNLIDHSFKSKENADVQFIFNNDFTVPKSSGVENFAVTVLTDPFSPEYDYQEYFIAANIKEDQLENFEILKKIRFQSCMKIDLLRYDIDFEKDGIYFKDLEMERHNNYLYQSIMRKLFNRDSSWYYKIAEEKEDSQFVDYYRHCTMISSRQFFRTAYLGNIELFEDDIFKKTLSNNLNFIFNLQVTPDDINEGNIQLIADNLKLIRY